MEFYEKNLYRYGEGFVSIPNGMEFYNSLDQSALLRRRFNSQRDGIL